MLVGVDETIRCIASTRITSPEGAPLCLAFKTGAHLFGAGLYLTDDGYVLAVVPKKGVKASSYLGNSIPPDI